MKKLIIILIVISSYLILVADEATHCAKCGVEITEGIYYQVEDKIYCEECYKKYIQIICDYCGLPIEGEYNIDFWGNKFHSYHEEETEKCEFCNRLISENISNGGRTYADSTIICNICYQTAIFKIEIAKILLNDVISELVWQGIKIDKSYITLHLVDRNELAEKGKNKQVNLDQKGLAIHNYTVNSTHQIVEQQFEIYILQGMPKLYFVKVLAHELMHVWQFRNAILDNDLALSEGSCNYAAYLVLKSFAKKPQYRFEPSAEKEIDYLLQTIEKNDDPIYGKGFQAVKKMADRMGVSYWLRYLQKYDTLP